MEKIKAKNIVLQVLGFSLAIGPALLIATLIFKNSVNVPFWDDWEVSLFLKKVFPEFRLTLGDLIAQHNESRYAFPRLIFMALVYLNKGNWDQQYQMWVSFALTCLVSINIFILIKLTTGNNLIKIILLAIISNFLIFAPIQYENFLWGIQLIVFMPIACITTGLVAIYSGINPTAKLIICLLLCTISTYSYANGMLSWIILLPGLAISKSSKWQDIFRQKWLYFVWIAAFTINMVVYFYDYQKPEQLPSFTLGLLNIDKTILFFFSFLGASLGRGIITTDVVGSVNNSFDVVNYTVIIIGIILTILFLAAWLYLWIQRKNFALIYRMVPWLTIGSYTVISAVITSLGRVGFGIGTSLALRYMTFSVYLPLALVNLIAIIYNDAKNRGYLKNKRKVFVQGGIGLLIVVFLYFYIITSNFAIGRTYLVKLDRLQGKACLAFIKVAPEEICLIDKVYPDFVSLKPRVQLVKDFKLIDATKFVKNKNIQEITETPINSLNHLEYGSFDNLEQVNNYNYSAGGWAILPGNRRPADAVILTYETDNGEDIIFAVSDTYGERADIVKATNIEEYSMSGWQKTFTVTRLPKNLVKINAWAFDTETVKAYKISGTHVIENE